MSPELFQFVNVIMIPVVGGIVLWLWKLENRIYTISADLRNILTREEFLSEMHSLRAELYELRKEVKS